MSFSRYLSKLGQLLNSSGQVTAAGHADGSVTPVKLSSDAQFMGFKNRIINGAMMIDQRNAGAALTNSTGFLCTLDRWTVQTVGSSCVIQQVAGSTGNNKALRITGAAGNTNTLLSQRIEANNIGDLAGQTVTVSFTLYGSGSGSVSVRFIYPTATDNYTSITEPVAGTSVSFTSTATTYTVTRTLDANANKGLWVVIERGATGAGVTWSVENFQLEKGSTATSFDYRPYGTELALCQRYYELVYSLQAIYGTAYAGYRYASAISFAVVKRATPSLTITITYSWPSNTGASRTIANDYISTNGANFIDQQTNNTLYNAELRASAEL